MGLKSFLSSPAGGIVATTLGGPVGADLWASYNDYNAQRDANDANLASAREANQSAERLSNTSYQRAMADMKAAGLNPMLAMNLGGASVPSQSGGTVQAASKGGMGRAVSKNIYDAINTASGINLQRSQATQADSQASLNAANVGVSNSTASLNNARTAESKKEALRIQAETEATLRETNRKDEIHTYDKEIKKIDSEWRDTQHKIDAGSKVIGTVANAASLGGKVWKGVAGMVAAGAGSAKKTSHPSSVDAPSGHSAKTIYTEDRKLKNTGSGWEPNE